MLDIFVFTVESRSIMIIIYTWYIICIAIPNSLHIWYVYRYFEHLSTRPSQWFHLVQVKILALLPQMLTKDGKLMGPVDPHEKSMGGVGGSPWGTRRSISKSTRSTWLFHPQLFKKDVGLTDASRGNPKYTHIEKAQFSTSEESVFDSGGFSYCEVGKPPNHGWLLLFLCWGTPLVWSVERYSQTTRAW